VDFRGNSFFFFRKIGFFSCMSVRRRVKGRTSMGREGQLGFGSQDISIDLRRNGNFMGGWKGKRGIGGFRRE
jgi:hypothetical protein